MSDTFLRNRWRLAPPRYRMPGTLRPWLVDTGSLTARVRARCRHFAVRVLRQEGSTAYVDERQCLSLRRDEKVWVREVVLLADDRPVVFARSVLPRSSIRGAWSVFHEMGDQPLGAMLFARPGVRRAPLRFGRLDARDARYHSALAVSRMSRAPLELWARRSVFSLHDKPLLVTEIFLPDIFDLSA